MSKMVQDMGIKANYKFLDSNRFYKKIYGVNKSSKKRTLKKHVSVLEISYTLK